MNAKANKILEQQIKEGNVPVCDNKTPSLNWKEQDAKKWFLIDAKGQTLGKLAVVIADILRGKRNSQYTPHIKCGSNVIVINAKHIEVTGRKEIEKKYYRHSGYIGGLKTTDVKTLRLGGNASYMIHSAVKGMLGRGPKSHQLRRSLRVFENELHSHEGQKPEILNVNFKTKKKYNQ